MHLRHAMPCQRLAPPKGKGGKTSGPVIPHSRTAPDTAGVYSAYSLFVCVGHRMLVQGRTAAVPAVPQRYARPVPATPSSSYPTKHPAQAMSLSQSTQIAPCTMARKCVSLSTPQQLATPLIPLEARNPSSSSPSPSRLRTMLNTAGFSSWALLGRTHTMRCGRSSRLIQHSVL